MADTVERAIYELSVRGQDQLDRAAQSLDRVAVSEEKVTRATRTTEDGIVRLIARYDQRARAEQELQRRLDQIARYEEEGVGSTQQRAQAVALVTQRYNDQIAALGRSNTAINDNNRAAGTATASTGQLRFAVQNLGFQINDIATSLASGGSPFRVLAQQGGQVVQAFQQGGGVSAVLGAAGSAIRSMITPTTAAVAGIGALAVGIGVLVSRAVESEGAIRQFNVTLKGMDAQALANGDSLEAMARRLRDVGISAAEARTQIQAITRAGLNPAAGEQIIRAGADLSAYLGGDQTSKLVQALSGGVGETVRFGLAIKALTVAEAENALEMARHGQSAQALDQAFQKIAEHARGLEREALSPTGKAMRDLRVAWDDLLNRLADSGAITALVRGFTDLVRAVEGLASAKPPPWVAALLGAAVPGVGGLGGLLLNNLGSSAGAPVATASIPLDMNALVNAVIQVESRGNPNAVSSAGAMGLMQLMPGTARQYGVSNPFNGSENVAGGTAYLKDLLAHYGGNVELALMAYNWGQGNLDKALAAAQGNAASAAIPGPVRGYASQVISIANATSTGVSTGDNRTGAFEADQLTKARQREADATRGVGLANDFLKARLEAEQIAADKNLSTSDQAKVAAGLRAAAVSRLANEIANEAAETNREIDGLRSVSEAYRQSYGEGRIQEAVVRAQSEAFRRFGETSSDEAQKFVAARSREIIALEKWSEASRNAQDALAQRDQQQLLERQISLAGQLPEIAQKELAILQEKQRIAREFPFLTEQEKANRLASVQAVADLNVKLAETSRSQQQIDSMFSQIGDTISRTIGDAVTGIFDKNKVIDWGNALKSALSSIIGSVLQAMVIRPLTGDLLGMLGASPAVLSQFGVTGGTAGAAGGLSTGTLLQGGGLLSNLFGFGGGGSGTSLFGNFTNWLNTSVGVPLGFGSPVTLSSAELAGLGIPNSSAFSATLPGSLFGSTSFTGFLGGAGLGFGAGSLLNSLLGGNQMLGTVGSGLGSLAGAGIGSLFGGPLIGGLLGGLLGGGLFGMFGNNQPRNASAGAGFDLSSFSAYGAFAGGNPQIDQATAAAAQQLQQFLALLKTAGGSLAGSLLLQNGVNTGVTLDYSNVTGYGTGRISMGRDPLAAVRQIEQALIQSVTGLSDSMRQVLSQVSDPNQLQSAIAFGVAYDNLKTAADSAFSEVEKDTKTIGPFATAMNNLNATFDGLRQQAEQFGLSIDPINAALAEASKRLTEDFNTGVADLILQITDPLAYATEQVQKAGDAMIAEATAVGGDLVQVQQLTTLQLQQVTEQFNAQLEQQYQSLEDFLQSLQTGTLSGLSTIDQLNAAVANYQNELSLVLAGQTDQIDELIAAASSAIQLSQQAYGNAPQTVQLQTEISAGINDALSTRSFAGGTSSTPAGWIQVGEQGPEWMYQPGGATILPTGVAPANDDAWNSVMTLPAPAPVPVAPAVAPASGGGDVADLLRELLDIVKAGNAQNQGGLAAVYGAVIRLTQLVATPAVSDAPRTRFA